MPPKTTIRISTDERSGFDVPLAGFAFDRAGNLRVRRPVKSGKLTLPMSEREVARSRIVIAPVSEQLGEDSAPTPERLLSVGGYEPVLRSPEGGLLDAIRIPGSILERWPFCLCTVRGRVQRTIDSRAVCGARVKICEVDRIPRWILNLPELDLLRLRDVLLRPNLPPLPDPVPESPLPTPPRPRLARGPRFDTTRLERPLLRLARDANVSTDLSGSDAVRNLPEDLRHRLASTRSPEILRAALQDNWRLLPPFLCLQPRLWKFRCDEVAVVTTDPNGRFETRILYDCDGDHPDLFFSVEYDFGGGWETVYSPPIACSTRWDYECGSEVTLRVPDPRVPGCNEEPDLDGRQVWVLSIGRSVSVGEILQASAGADEGKVEEGFSPSGTNDALFGFGGRLEPRVWFGRSALEDAGIQHYLWSVRPLGGSEADWSPITRQVIRHYARPDGTAPVEVMGPLPSGDNAGRFRIRPTDPPEDGIEWLVADEREDLASAHLVTVPPPRPPAGDPPAPCGIADPNAGKYEFKLELFDGGGNVVDWDAAGITLRVATNEAPFGSGPVETDEAAAYHRIRQGGQTMAFRMVLHIDNSRSGGAVKPIDGTGIDLDLDCGVVSLTGGAPTLDVGFDAGRPGGMAHVSLTTRRGYTSNVAAASASGAVGSAAGGFAFSPSCSYTRVGMSPATFLGACDQAAFSQHLRVWALTVDGYSRLSGLDATDVAAFMLSRPCRGSGGRGPGRGGGSGNG